MSRLRSCCPPMHVAVKSVVICAELLQVRKVHSQMNVIVKRMESE